MMDYLRQIEELEEVKYYYYLPAWVVEGANRAIEEGLFDELPTEIKVALGYKWDMERKEWCKRES